MTGVERTVSRLAAACGSLCVIGIVGPVVGNMRLQLIGVFGYAVLLPILAVLLMPFFGKGTRAFRPHDGFPEKESNEHRYRRRVAP